MQKVDHNTGFREKCQIFVGENWKNNRDYNIVPRLLCNLCSKLIKNYRIKFFYDHVVNGGIDPDDTDKFCSKILSENVAVVKVEMATKSVTRAVKDQVSILLHTYSRSRSYDRELQRQRCKNLQRHE
jgi:hypothetical protein